MTAWVAFFSRMWGASVSDLIDAPPARAASAASSLPSTDAAWRSMAECGSQTDGCRLCGVQAEVP